MNETSSRSHAVFTLFLTSNRFDETAKLNTEKCARISLVDLAGSERANSTGATGVRLKEGANINKSLTTLGKVISALAESGAAAPSTSNKKSSATSNPNFVPYRDSVLTWLLKDSLGGNSKTAMIAAISPADYDETLSTLRYADQAKRIKNKAIVNEDPNARLIRELKEELQALRDTLMIYAPEEVEKIIQQKKAKASGRSSRASSRAAATVRATTASPMLLISPESPIATQRGNSLLTKEQVIDQLQSSEKLLSEVKQTWEEKMSKTEEIHREREKALEELGIIVEKDNMVGVYAPKSIHLINLNEDPLMTECLMYQIKPGITKVGKSGSKVPADIRLSGGEIWDEHCYFENNAITGAADGEAEEEEENRLVTIYPGKESVTLVNGMRILQPKVLHSGYRIIFGSGLHHLFRFNNPDEVRREREQRQVQTQNLLSTSPEDSDIGSMISPSSTTMGTNDIVDWKFAHNEAVKKYGVTNNASDLAVMTDEDLKQLSDGITKVQELRNRKRISSDSHSLLFNNNNDNDSTMEISPRTSFSSSSNKRFSAISGTTTLLTEEDLEEDKDVVLDEEDKKRFLKATSTEENERLIRAATEEMQLQKKEYEEKLKHVESSNLKKDEINKERDELEAKYTQIKQEMEKTLEQQKLAYESKIKRISAHLPPGTALSSDNLLVGYTAKNAAQHLLRQAVDKWRELKYVKMAEDCLIHAVVLKEANIMAKELGKNIVYQFIVVHDDISSNPLSFWESTSALQPFTREPDTHLIKAPKPCIAVQVIDHVHRANYIWSIPKLQHRIRRMRRLYDYTDGPLFTGQHFNREDPFYETPCPRFSLIGLAQVPLRNLTLQLHADNYVDVYCRNTGKIMGQIRVLVTPIARSVSRKHQLQQQLQRPSLNVRQSSSIMEQQGEKYLLHIGQQQVFEIRIQELRGVSESDFTQVHAQFRLSSFGNVERYSTADKIYQTDPISNFDHSHIVFNQCQTLSVNITENMMQVILNQGLTIEVYGQVQESYLYSLVEHVSSSGSSQPTTPINTTTEPTSLFVTKATTTNVLPASKRCSIDRRFSLEKCTFDGILMEERHDILAWIQICELDSDGQYVPVQVIHSTNENKQHQDTFCLRQGLQRRIAFTLSHDSGKQFEWTDIKNTRIGNVRLVDSKGRITESPPHEPVPIHLFKSQQHILFERNGMSQLTAQGPWDSSLHDSLFLNRVTASGQRIRLTLSWQIECDKCITPLKFKMDISVQIGTMISTSSSTTSIFRQLLLGGGGGSDNNHSNQNNGNSSSSGNKSSAMFIVQLKPPMTRQVRELWRLNTANKYVRGEEFIGSWKPRGVSLVTDYRTARKKMLHRESIAAFRHALILAGHPQTKVIQKSQSEHMFMFGQNLNQSQQQQPHIIKSDIKTTIDPEALTRKVIDLWKTQFGTREEVTHT